MSAASVDVEPTTGHIERNMPRSTLIIRHLNGFGAKNTKAAH